MLNVLVTIDSDAELLTQHTTLTINFCECYAAVLDSFESLIPLRSETESSLYLVSSSIDLALQVCQSEMLKSFGKKTLMLELLRAKINSMFIIGSPTISVAVEPSSCFLLLSHLFSPECITKQGDRKTLLQSCGFVNVAQLSGLSAIIRINKCDGVNPSENVIFNLVD